MSTDNKFLDSLARVAASEPNFILWLELRLSDYLSQTSAQRDDVSLRWAQGRAQECEQILAALRAAKER